MSKSKRNAPGALALHVTLRDLIDGETALGALVSRPLPARLTFTLGMVIQVLAPHYREYNKTRDTLLARYGKEKDGEPGTFEIARENRQAYLDELETLLDTPVELQGIGRIPASALGEVSLTPQQAFALRWLVVNDLESLFEG